MTRGQPELTASRRGALPHAHLRQSLRRTLPWLVLAGALVLATMPGWRPWMVGASPSLDELLSLRCAP